MATRSLFTHKRGDTFLYAGLVSLPAPVGTWVPTAQIRLPTKIDTPPPIEELEVTLSDPVAPETRHGVLLEATAEQTELWPIAPLICDIQFTDDANGVVLSTDTFGFTMIKDVTHDDPV